MSEITRVVVLGDSHTVGYGTKSRKTWVDHLKDNFFEDREGLEKYFFYNFSKEGMTTTDAAEFARNSLDLFLRDTSDYSSPRWRSLSIVALGVNEASVPRHGQPLYAFGRFQHALHALTKVLIPYGQVLFVDFPPVCEAKMEAIKGHSIQPQQEMHQQYREAIHEYAEREGIQSVRLPTMDSASITVEDGVHLNEEGHQMVYERVLSAFEPIVRGTIVQPLVGREHRTWYL